jgi:hypothetical protein
MADFASPAPVAPEVRALLDAVALRPLLEYLLGRVRPAAGQRHVRLEAHFEAGSLRRLDVHLGPLKGQEELAGVDGAAGRP